MARNIEIKARVMDPEALRRNAANLSDCSPEIIRQEDTFFRSPRGRLKLREMPSARAQLIFYERPDQNGPKLSNYQIFETGNPEALKAVLSSVLGIRGIVRKERCLYKIGQTRVHLDQVEELGLFMELEVVLRPGQSDTEGEKIARDLMDKLEFPTQDLVKMAYIDLLELGDRNVP
jgi:predicted adenylyl cyclase CyaB